MPRNEIVREVTLGQLLKETVDKYPNEDAVAYVDREYKQTWREFSDTVDTMAKGLMAMGIKKGEKVAVWATNVPHWVALQFATARIGAILLTINTNYRSEEINYVLKQSDCETTASGWSIPNCLSARFLHRTTPPRDHGIPRLPSFSASWTAPSSFALIG